MLSLEIRVMVAPQRAYADLARRDSTGGLWTAARRPLFVALVQGIALAMIATHTVSAATAASLTLCWTAALAVQLLAATLLITSAPRRGIAMSRALDLFFLGHAPWSLWLLTCAAALTTTRFAGGFPVLALMTMAVPAALTARIIAAFTQHVLHTSRRDAVRGTLLHQAFIWTAFGTYVAYAVQLWPRLLGSLAR